MLVCVNAKSSAEQVYVAGLHYVDRLCWVFCLARRPFMAVVGVVEADVTTSGR